MIGRCHLWMSSSSLYIGSESVECFPVIWFCLKVEFSWERVSYSDTHCCQFTQQRILDIYRYLFVQVTLIATLRKRFCNKTLRFVISSLSFVSLYECCCIIVFDSIIYLNQDSIQLLLQYISDWSPGVTASVLFTISRNKLLLYKSCLPDVFVWANSRVLMLVSIFI